MKSYLYLLLIIILSCKSNPETIIAPWEPYDESEELLGNAEHKSKRMQFKLIQSKGKDRNELWKEIGNQLDDFSEQDYLNLHSLIYEQDILSIQKSIAESRLTYKKLTQWYLYRIVRFENDKDKTLHALISINSNAVKEATQLDKKKKKNANPIYGMPVLLKDNINTEGMTTTAGAIALQNNRTSDAFIVSQLKKKNAIILGKVNLSEWAYYLCQGCPLGYSAIGGQSLNPYGRKVFETGGSSAGSGTSMAANYAVAAVGTETSGSIISPSSQNSLVGLKPTIGVLSRTGIVPISSNLDTPGPMTRSVVDNAILLSAMIGEDSVDDSTVGKFKEVNYWEGLDAAYIQGKRFGVIKSYMEDSLYALAISQLEKMNAVVVEVEPPSFDYDGFTTFLNADMKKDLPGYLNNHAGSDVKVNSVSDVVEFNNKDTSLHIPYEQHHFKASANEDIEEEELKILQSRFKREGIAFFSEPMDEFNLDAFVSINNYNSGQAAMARFPCVTLPMGYEESGEPKNLTFIAKPFQEHHLLKLAYAFEQNYKIRQAPKLYIR